jgi:hypothetical protein
VSRSPIPGPDLIQFPNSQPQGLAFSGFFGHHGLWLCDSWAVTG